LLHRKKSSRSFQDSFIAIVNDRLQQPAMSSFCLVEEHLLWLYWDSDIK
jgi:hypothetical protein